MLSGIMCEMFACMNAEQMPVVRIINGNGFVTAKKDYIHYIPHHMHFIFCTDCALMS